jgi:hypothetical protein
MKPIVLSLLLAVLSASLASSAHAQVAQAPAPPPPAPPLFDSTVHRHLGFFLRLDLGLGYMNSSATAGGVDQSARGGAGAFSVAVGGAIAEDLILAGHLWDSAAVSPTIQIGGQSTSTGSGVSVSLGGVGPSLSYYLMPANVYLAVTPSLTWLALTVNGTRYETNAGFGGRVAVGKEWWVGDHWGLGLEGQFSFGINGDQGQNAPTWTTLGGSLAFSATYN